MLAVKEIGRYEIKTDDHYKVFEFVSTGPKGEIVKLVQYSLTNSWRLYNLGFGDKNLETEEIDDFAISGNSDSLKILMTIVTTLYLFTDKHKNALVCASGSTESRTRLYRMKISKHLEEALIDFQIYGQRNHIWEKFKRGIEYNAFLAKRK